MKMDVKLLEAFRTVMDNSSVTRAATILRVTQPAVSAQIARLEALVGFSLFERTGGRLKPTPEGRQFYDEAMHALGMIDRLEQVSASIRSGRAGNIVIASYPAGSVSILPELVARFGAAHPDATVRMINRTSEEVRSIFEATAVDIGMAMIPIDFPGIEVRKYRVPSVAVMPKGHPAAAKRVITPADFSGLPFASMSLTRLIGHQIRGAFIESGADFRMVAECEYFSSICSMVASGLGVSVVDCWSALTFRSQGLEVRPFEPKIDTETGVFYSAKKTPNVLTRDFLALLDEKLTSPPTFDAED
jgi:DNA-binding transcriptional LysR family regulator